MIRIEEARDRILQRVAPLGVEVVPVSESGGRVLAQPLASRRSLPAFDNSAMDGYGVRALELASASPEAPLRLPLAGAQLAGGAMTGTLPEGHAIRITTGAPIPPGVDAVVMREWSDESAVDAEGGGSVAFARPVAAGEAIRRRGEDVAEGEVLVPAGTTITPGVLNLLAAAGHVMVPVHRVPRVAILASGDELKELGEPFGELDVLNSNAHALAAAVRQAGAHAVLLGIARDSLDAHVEQISAGSFADVLLTIGGVSMGSHDFVRPALEALGVELDFWKVAMRPGKPLAFATRGGQAIFGLPGNPVSSLVTFELFVRPALRKLMGHPRPLRAPLRARLEGPGMRKKPDVAFYARARVTLAADGALRVRLADKQGSGQISGLALANALCVLPIDVSVVSEGDEVEVLLLEELHLG